MPRPSPRVRLNSPAPDTSPSSHLRNSLSPSPQASPSRRGPVESTFQRSFRGICRNFEVINKNWSILHNQGYECLKKLGKDTDALKKAVTARSVNPTMDVRNRHKKASKAVEDCHLQLFVVMDKLARQYDLLKVIKGQLEELLQEMTRRKGLEAAHQEPLLTSWSLATFVEAFASIVHLFSISYHTSRSILAQVDLGDVPPTELQAAWLSLRLSKNLFLLDFLDVCQIELYEPDDEDD